MLTTYLPELEDLWFKQAILADPETMSYNLAWGGTMPFPEEDWPAWYAHWILNHDNKRYYRYLQNESKDFIGEIAYHYDSKEGIYLANVIVHAPYRGRGYGRAGLALLSEKARDHGLPALYDNLALDNPALGLFLQQGFVEVYRTEEYIMLKKDLQGES